VDAEDVEPDEAPLAAPLDAGVLPVAPPVEAGVPADTPLVPDDAPVLPAFETDDPPPPLVPVVVAAVKAVAVVADWICMESLDWFEVGAWRHLS